MLGGGCLVAVTFALRVAPLAAPASEPEAASAPSVSARLAGAPAPRRSTKVTVELAAGTCTFADDGIGDYKTGRTAGGFEVLARDAALAPQGEYDLLLFAHGSDPVRRVLGPAGKPIVIASINRGDSSGDYAGTFPDRRSFDAALSSIDQKTSELLGRPARASRVALASFSAGFELVREALTVAGDDPLLTGVILLDSLYGSYAGQSEAVDATGLAPFERAASRALSQPKFAFVLTHSEVPTQGYASTAEVASALVDRLVVRSSLVTRRGERGLYRVAEERGFLMRGYGGKDKGAHCAHLGLLPELVDVWRSRL